MVLLWLYVFTYGLHPKLLTTPIFNSHWFLSEI